MGYYHTFESWYLLVIAIGLIRTKPSVATVRGTDTGAAGWRTSITAALSALSGSGAK